MRGTRRNEFVGKLKEGERVNYFFKMLKRHSSLSNPKNVSMDVSADSPVIKYNGRRLIMPEFSRENNLPGILAMVGPRDENLAKIVDAVSHLRKASPFCTYDSPVVGGATIPFYEWPQIDFPIDARMAYLQTNPMANNVRRI